MFQSLETLLRVILANDQELVVYFYLIHVATVKVNMLNIPLQ